jgi:hypothetical protein
MKNPPFTSLGICAVSANVTMKGSFVVIYQQFTILKGIKSSLIAGMLVALGTLRRTV